ncbi:DNA-binding transcriptional regulator, MarR family [Actinacidiphila yanglinensis]|uniref:DNA-binding transcriptional regulator, MarR family n=1 Tax=Actinacidiphila yanglinensis TaxID=310779 RepID=A0A1H6CU70_9ACTN|nr:MarR family transcriptional regulator [Actinacidiphila yanglinensis]SEG76631.1 DNA-binding transcriptional regulator, MarR family [Actinacidiphila yanglinensis]
MDSAHDMHFPADQADTPQRLRTLPSRLLNLTAAQGERMVGGRLAAVHARKWHYAVLAALEESGPASQATLSRRTGIYRSDLVAVINELAGRDLVQRAPDPDDRRRNVITLTGAGRAHLRHLDAILDAAQDDLLAPLTAKERDDLTSMLTRLLAHHAERRADEHAQPGR